MQELLDLASSRQPPDGELVGERAWRVAEVLWRAGRTREADAMAERAITAYAASPAGDRPDGKQAGHPAAAG